MDGVVFLLFSSITKVLASLPAKCVFALVCVAAMQSGVSSSSKRTAERTKNGLPEEFETVKVEKVKQKGETGESFAL